MKVAITGAYGYLGSKIVKKLKENGIEPIALTRNPRNANEFLFSLNHTTPSAADFKKMKVDALIHCGWDLKISVSKKKSLAINVEGSRKLLRSVVDANIRNVIFISSMSAYEGCQSTYGKHKLKVEKAFIQQGSKIIRPGLIWSDSNPRGLYGTLCKIIKYLPVVPIIGSGNNKLFLVHDEDLTNLIIETLNYNSQNKNEYIVTAAEPTAIKFKDILKTISSKNNKQTLFIAVPWQLIWLTLKFIEVVKLPFPLKSDSVIGLIKSDGKPIFQNNLKFKSFDLKT